MKDELSDPKNIEDYKLQRDLHNTLKICMKTEAAQILNSNKGEDCILLIIDEAHHSAAPSYKPFFNNKIGILGLTATPTRTDDSQLEFEAVSYSISFNELVERGVIIKPVFENFYTNNTIDVTSLDQSNDSELNKFNTPIRNEQIADEIIKRSDRYKKVVVFVGTNAHVISLFETVKKKVSKQYEHVGYIYGGDHNDKNWNNDHYLEWHKDVKSSVLINCKLLNEGYNDPSINAIVMAVPTRSILYYTQCVGRVVRGKKKGAGYVLEVVDNLPNINYRIDNKWLFADISDRLEPIIKEETCYDLGDFKKTLKRLLDNHKLSMPKEENFDKLFDKIKDYQFDRISLLLFSSNSNIDKESKWKFLIFTPDNKFRYVALFNDLSNNIESYYNLNYDYLFKNLETAKEVSADEYFQYRIFKVDLISSLNQAYNEIKAGKKVERLEYIIFTKGERYPQGFLDFIKGCFNEDELKSNYNDMREIKKYVIKFPLPVEGYEGLFLNDLEFQFCTNFIKTLMNIKSKDNVADHEKHINEVVFNMTNIPIPLRFIESMKRIVREDTKPYYFSLGG